MYPNPGVRTRAGRPPVVEGRPAGVSCAVWVVGAGVQPARCQLGSSSCFGVKVKRQTSVKVCDSSHLPLNELPASLARP